MNKLIAAIAAVMIFTIPALAVEGDYIDGHGLVISENTVLTPGTLYQMQVDTLREFAEHEMKLKQRIGELERKVAGMQKQITLLHSKKADKQK